MQYRTYAQTTSVSDHWTENTPLESLGNEGSRRFRALAVWMALQAYGKEGFREMVERNCALAQEFADLLESSGVYKVHRPVLINGFAFTLNKEGVTDEEIHALERAIRAEGTTYLNPSGVCGVPHLRCSLSNWSVEQKDIEQVAKAVIEVGSAFL
jgi:glutamate/tyrosine decarboxylase-like PLP-dependent enzyme